MSHEGMRGEQFTASDEPMKKEDDGGVSKRRGQRFEHLIAWQKARRVNRDIYAVSRKEAFSKDVRLVGQIRQSAVSVMANIAEGYERHSVREFYRYLCIAKGSCAEMRSLLFVALDVGNLTRTEFDDLMSQAAELARILGGLLKAVGRAKSADMG